MSCLLVIRCVTGADRLQNITYTPGSITDVLRNRGCLWFGHVCRVQRYNIVMQAYTRYFKGQRKRGRSLSMWSDQISCDAGLSMLTAERHAVNKTGRMGATSRRTARVQPPGGQRGVQPPGRQRGVQPPGGQRGVQPPGGQRRM